MKYFSGRFEFEDIKNPLLDRIANPVLDLYFRLIRRIVP